MAVVKRGGYRAPNFKMWTKSSSRSFRPTVTIAYAVAEIWNGTQHVHAGTPGPSPFSHHLVCEAEGGNHTSMPTFSPTSATAPHTAAAGQMMGVPT